MWCRARSHRSEAPTKPDAATTEPNRTVLPRRTHGAHHRPAGARSDILDQPGAPRSCWRPRPSPLSDQNRRPLPYQGRVTVYEPSRGHEYFALALGSLLGTLFCGRTGRKDMVVNTDYLIVGAGASGLAFADTLLAEADIEVTVVDRRQAVGGHWLHAYPFVRLHTPSSYYGVNSLPLGEDRIDQDGENAGYYERAMGSEVCDYFARAAIGLSQTQRARVLTCHEYLSRGSNGARIKDLTTGELHDVAVRRKIVDARYLEASVPATHCRPFDVAPSARVVPVNDLPAAAGSADHFAVLGSGKTAVDACTWLLDNDVEPDRTRWIRPREAWFYDRRYFQPLEQVGAIMEGLALDAEAGPTPWTSRTCSRGSRPRDDSCASIPGGRRGCTAGRCSAPPSSVQCGRSRMSSGSAAYVGSRPTGSCSSAGRPRPAPAPRAPRPRRRTIRAGSCQPLLHTPPDGERPTEATKRIALGPRGQAVAHDH